MINWVGIFSILCSLPILLLNVLFLEEATKIKGGLVRSYQLNPAEMNLIYSSIFLGFYLVVQGAGILRRKEWGRKLTLLLPFVYVGTKMVFAPYIFTPAHVCFMIVYGIFFLVYFTRSKIKMQFQ